MGIVWPYKYIGKNSGESISWPTTFNQWTYKNRDISGKIPDELGNYRNLKVLGLANTKVSLGKLSKFQILSVYTTMLSGEIPKEGIRELC